MLREEVEVLRHDITIDHHNLSLWYFLDLYIDHFNDLLIENENNLWGGSSLKFELSKDELQELDEILKISDFEEKWII